MATVLTQEQRSFILALAHRVVPQTLDLGAAEDERFLAVIEDAIAARPPAMQRQIGLFLTVLRWLPLVRYRAPLDRLHPGQQDEVLRWFQDNPVPLVRKGFWGLKALIFMGYYGRAGLGPDIGYTPSRQGNHELHRRREQEQQPNASAVGEA